MKARNNTNKYGKLNPLNCWGKQLNITITFMRSLITCKVGAKVDEEHPYDKSINFVQKIDPKFSC